MFLIILDNEVIIYSFELIILNVPVAYLLILDRMLCQSPINLLISLHLITLSLLIKVCLKPHRIDLN